MTGRIRYRVLKQWFKDPVLVLQVERTGLVSSWGGGRCDTRHATWWVDCHPVWKMTEESNET